MNRSNKWMSTLIKTCLLGVLVAWAQPSFAGRQSSSGTGTGSCAGSSYAGSSSVSSSNASSSVAQR